MLTWAMVYLVLHYYKEDERPDNPGLVFLISMGCDVGIVYYIACAFVGKAL